MSTIEDINKIIFGLFQFRASEVSQTAKLKKLGHTNDLCPLVKRIIQSILDSFDKYKKVTYDIQGFGDKGTDVVLIEKAGDSNNYICFQIKNEKDFIRENDILKELRSQHSQSIHSYNPCIAYYILLFADIHTKRIENKNLKNKRLNERAKKNIDAIRKIESTFTGYENLFVIEPEYLVTFINLTHFQIDAFTKSKFGDGDVVYKNAIDITRSLTLTESSIIYFIIWKYLSNSCYRFDIEEFSESSDLNSVYEELPNFIREYYEKSEDELFEEFEDLYGGNLDKVSITKLKNEALENGQ